MCDVVYAKQVPMAGIVVEGLTVRRTRTAKMAGAPQAILALGTWGST